MSRAEQAARDPWKALLLATFVVAAALRFFGLQSGLWYDEIMTLVLSVRHPLRQIVTEFPGMNEHPLYSVLAHVSIQMFGESAWALRLPACIFGIAMIVVVYVLGAQLMPRVEAWAAAAVLTVSYHHIWFSQNARGYTLIGLLSLLSVHLLLKAGRTGRRVDYVAYAIVCAAGIYAHMTMAFVVAGHAVVLLSARALGKRVSAHRWGSMAWSWVAVCIVAAVAYAPLMRSVLAVMWSQGSRPSLQVATAGWALGEMIRSLISGAGAPAVLAAAVFASVGAVALWRGQPLAFALLTSPVVVTAVGVVVLRQPIRPRFLFFASGAAAIFVGRGIGAALRPIAPGRGAARSEARPAAVVIACVVLVTLSALSLPRNYRVPKQDFDGAVRSLEAGELQGMEIAASGPACLPLAIYYGKTGWRCLKTIQDWRDIRQAGHRVLVVHTLIDYVQAELRERLRNDCPPVERFEGTLGDGDIIVCDATTHEAAAAPLGAR